MELKLLVDEIEKCVVGLMRRRLRNRDGLSRKGSVDSRGRENREKEDSLGRLGDKDENFGFRMDFILIYK